MTGRLIPRGDLRAAERDAMRSLLDAHFEGVTESQFDADLLDKKWVVLVERDGRLLGFSTLDLSEQTVNGETLLVVCSGDTIVSSEAWGSAAFPREWINAVYRLRDRHPGRRIIWLLLTSGYRTYRFLPVFWRKFYPRFDEPTPASWQTLLDTLAATRFHDRFDLASGIVRLANPQKLRGALSEVPAARTDEPNVAFFLARNPGHADGDELVCVADLDPEFLTPAGRRVVYGSSR